MLASGELREEKLMTTRFGVAVRYRQYYHDLPVVGGSVMVKLNAEGQPVSLFSSVAEWRDVAMPDYSLSEFGAISLALEYMNVKAMRGQVSVVRAVLPRAGRPVFIWRVVIPAREPLGDWELFIDAETGDIIQLENRLRRVNGVGLVFDPDPKSATGDEDLQDDNDAAEAIPADAYSEVDLPEINQEDSLWVLTGQFVDTSPTSDRARMEEPSFLFDRADDRFEEVMAYYHLDRQARYLVELGFDDLPPTPQPVDVNGIENDMSYFSPATGVITTGSGGVDDAEDADVLLHEYGHALLERILPDWRGGDADLMVEGLCDYFAGDWSLAVAPDFQPTLLFNWDGHNEFWDGRVLDAGYSYPDDADRETHDAGQLWSALLTEVRRAANDRDAWNTVVCDHLYALGDSATVPDAAEALLASDQTIAGGRFRSLIVRSCERRGVLPYGLHSPTIVHQPLRDTENLNAERDVTAQITSDTPLDSARLWVIYRFGEEAPDTVQLEHSLDGNDVFIAQLPAPGVETDVFYYLNAYDASGVFATDPNEAPMEWHRFHAGSDRTEPVIAGADSIYDTVFPEGEILFGALVTDNIAVSDVSLVWFHGRNEPGGIVALEPDELDSSLFIGRFRWSVESGEIIQYLVTATDASAAGNSAVSRRRSFAVQQQVVLDDFETGNHRWLLTGWHRDNSDARYGDWSLADRDAGGVNAPREAIAELDESWDLAFFDRVRLSFWERHEFDGNAGEQGWLEISADGGESWEQLLTAADTQQFWQLREVDLSDYCFGRSEPVQLRFRSETPEGASEAEGWFLDHLMLVVGNIVRADDDRAEFRSTFTLSIFPNPTNGRLMLEGSLPSPGMLSVSDVAGRLIYSNLLAAGRFGGVLPVNSLPTGVYLIRLASGGQTLVKPVTVIK